MSEYKTNPRMGNGCGTCPTHSHTNRGGNRTHNYGMTRAGKNTRTYGDSGCNNTTTHSGDCGCRKETCERNAGVESGCCERMEKLRKIEFAIVDVGHYLNAYPDSECALAYYHKLIEERKCLLKTIHEECGPTTLFDNTSETCWKWVEGPWPWHVDAY